MRAKFILPALFLLLSGSYATAQSEVDRSIKTKRMSEVREIDIKMSDYVWNGEMLENCPKETYERVRAVSRSQNYRDIIHGIKTPLEAQIYCSEVATNDRDATAAAITTLSDDGFFPYLLLMHSAADSKSSTTQENSPFVEPHMVFVYKDRKCGFGSIGMNYSDFNPHRDSIQDIVKRTSARAGKKFTGYSIFELR